MKKNGTTINEKWNVEVTRTAAGMYLVSITDNVKGKTDNDVSIEVKGDSVNVVSIFKKLPAYVNALVSELIKEVDISNEFHIDADKALTSFLLHKASLEDKWKEQRELMKANPLGWIEEHRKKGNLKDSRFPNLLSMLDNQRVKMKKVKGQPRETRPLNQQEKNDLNLFCKLWALEEKKVNRICWNASQVIADRISWEDIKTESYLSVIDHPQWIKEDTFQWFYAFIKRMTRKAIRKEANRHARFSRVFINNSILVNDLKLSVTMDKSDIERIEFLDGLSDIMNPEETEIFNLHYVQGVSKRDIDLLKGKRIDRTLKQLQIKLETKRAYFYDFMKPLDNSFLLKFKRNPWTVGTGNNGVKTSLVKRYQSKPFTVRKDTRKLFNHSYNVPKEIVNVDGLEMIEMPHQEVESVTVAYDIVKGVRERARVTKEGLEAFLLCLKQTGVDNVSIEA